MDVIDLVSLENTHQIGGGTVMPVDELRGIRKVAAEAGVPVYMDGAIKKRPGLFSQGRLGSPPPELPNHEMDTNELLI